MSVTPNIPAYGVSSTTLPSYGVTGGEYSTTPGYSSPLSSTYSPSYNTYKPPTPPPPPQESYGLPLAEPISSYEPVEEYGVPHSSPLPSYKPKPEPSYQPIEEYKPSYQPNKNYGVPSAPPLSSYESDQPYQHTGEYGAPSASPLPSYVTEPSYQRTEEYGVPSASPLPSYENNPAYQPVEEYEVPSASPLPSYEPEPAYQPIEEYGVPSASPLPSYETKPAYEPIEEYGVPSASPLPSYEPEPVYQPIEEYGVPSAAPLPSYEPQLTYQPTEENENLSAPIISTERPAYQPSSTYGPPVTPAYSPSPSYAPRPATSYAPIDVSTTYAPPLEAPAESYGAPLDDPIDDYEYDLTLSQGYEEPEGTYAVPAADTFSGYQSLAVSSTFSPPASLPDKWPSYPSSPELPSPPNIQYGGFKPPGDSRPSRYQERPPAYQQPSYLPTRPDISYGGFKALPSPVTPNIPAYGPDSGYSYPRPSNPLVLPQTTRKPVYSSTSGYVSTKLGYDNLPIYGGSPSPAPQYSTTLAPPPPPVPQYSTPAPFVDVESHESGYNYPVPANPLQLPQRTGRTGPKSKPEVGSVIPVGFSSATLSNGPFSSASSGGAPFREAPRQQKSFGNSDNANNIRPNTRPVGAFNGGNKASGLGQIVTGDKEQNLQSFVSFGPESGAGAQTGPRPGSGPGGVQRRPPPPRSQVSGSEEGRGGRLVVDAGLRRPAGNQRPETAGGRRNPSAAPQLLARPTRPSEQTGGFRSNQVSANNGLKPLSSNGGGSNGRFRPKSATRPNHFGSNEGSIPSGISANERPRQSGGRLAGNINGGFRPTAARPNNFESNSGFRPIGGRSPSNAGINEGFRPNEANNFGANEGFSTNLGGSRPNNAGPNGRPRQNGGSRPNAFSANERPRQSGGRPVGNNNGGDSRSTSSSPRGRPSGSFNVGRPSSSSNGGRPNSFASNTALRPNSFAGSRPRGNGNGGRPSGNRSNSNAFGSGRPSLDVSRPPLANGLLRQPVSKFAEQESRRGKQVGQGVTAISRPTQNRPAVLSKLAGAENNWNSGIWDKFGPGGFRTFNETLGPEVCQRPGLFRHPTDCTQFYECYWDKWIEKFTLHIFPCPVAMAVRQYDESISACNWPFLGPNCEGGTYH